MAETRRASLGFATAYGAARRGGYTGTYEEWCALMAEVADHLEENRSLYADTLTAKGAAVDAQTAAETAQGKAEDAQTAAETAQGAAEDAQEAAEAWAAGTTSGTPSATNNAAYYATQAGSSATAASGSASDAEAFGAGTRGGDDVTSGDDAYHNNAKYYAEQAEASAAALVIDNTLSESGQAADAAAVRNAITYVPMAINSFSISTPSDGLAEIGSTVTSVSLPFSLNKVPASLKLNNVAQTAAKTGTIALTEQEITSDTVFQLEAKDAGSPVHEVKTVTSSKTLSFVNRICYGAAASGTLNSAFVNALANKVLSGQKGRTFTVSVPSGQYIWYAIPKRLGACTFKVGGFEGGFEAAETVSVTNASGYTEDYYVYRSTNSGLGSTTVTVS